MTGSHCRLNGMEVTVSQLRVRKVPVVLTLQTFLTPNTPNFDALPLRGVDGSDGDGTGHQQDPPRKKQKLDDMQKDYSVVRISPRFSSLAFARSR